MNRLMMGLMTLKTMMCMLGREVSLSLVEIMSWRIVMVLRRVMMSVIVMWHWRTVVGIRRRVVVRWYWMKTSEVRVISCVTR